jgi:hypothetical protein
VPGLLAAADISRGAATLPITTADATLLLLLLLLTITAAIIRNTHDTNTKWLLQSFVLYLVPFHFCCHAGSLAGGTLLTITGAGFPAAADISRGTATLSITTADGSPCRVISSDYSSIRCITSPASPEVPDQVLSGNVEFTAGGSEADAAEQPPGVGVEWPGGLMVGPRGWVYDVFTNDK